MKQLKEDFTKMQFKARLRDKTQCAIQHTGWCCGTCFFGISKNLNNQDWQSLLLYRGSDKKEDLNNLPKDYMKSIKKIWNLIK